MVVKAVLLAAGDESEGAGMAAHLVPGDRGLVGVQQGAHTPAEGLGLRRAVHQQGFETPASPWVLWIKLKWAEMKHFTTKNAY